MGNMGATLTLNRLVSSMVVAQFTRYHPEGRLCVHYDGSTYIAGNHTDGDSICWPTYRNFHVKCSNDAVIQAVSVFTNFERSLRFNGGNGNLLPTQL